jgi:hypothetical protein
MRTPHARHARPLLPCGRERYPVCGSDVLCVGQFIRVWVKIMGPGKYENVGKSQSVVIMINPIIFTRTPPHHTRSLAASLTAHVARIAQPSGKQVGGRIPQPLLLPSQLPAAHTPGERARRRRAASRIIHGEGLRPELPARPFPSSIFIGRNRRDIGKSQSVWTDSKMKTAGSPPLASLRRRWRWR